MRHRSDLFAQEPRIGIWRDADRRTTGRNALYNPRFVRLKRGIALMEGVAGLPDQLDLQGLVALGGESRMATLEPVQQPPQFPTQPTHKPPSHTLLLSPALFKEDNMQWWGAGPGDDAVKLCDSFSGKVQTAVLDRPKRIGGWDSVAGRPLPLRPFVQPGSIWFIDPQQQSLAGLTLIGRSTAYGYGLAYLF
jgi:CRISPR type III-B/RAMP module-associated protein Cmr3